MATYRCLNLATKEVKYVTAANKAQARSHIARRTIQVEVADALQVMDDAAHGINLVAEKANTE